MTIAELTKEVHGVAFDKGWWPDGTSHRAVTRTMPEKIALMHSELSEALEDWRDGMNIREIRFDENGKPCGIPIELVDVIFRVLDFAGAAKIDIEAAIHQKLAYNRTRADRHGGKRG